MPCNDAWPIDYPDTSEMKKRLDITTRLACMYCKTVDEIPKFAQKWWKEHQEIDVKRTKEENLEKELKKLKLKQKREEEELKAKYK